MFALKQYQDDALNALNGFLQRVRVVGLDAAWCECAPLVPLKNGGKQAQLPYQKAAFGDIPCVCLRLPTGGGKTLLAAHAVARVGKTFCDTDAPVVLWLTPSDTIRSQTVAALNQAGHPYRQALEQNYSLHLAGRLDQWTLTLLPRDMKIAELVLRITVQGSRGQLRAIEYLQADGDRTELRIEPSGGQ